MAEYAEIARGKSSADAKTEEMELRVGDKLIIEALPGDKGVRVTEHFHTSSVHRPEVSEFGPDKEEEFHDHIAGCTADLFSGSDGEQEEEPSGPQVTVSEGE